MSDQPPDHASSDPSKRVGWDSISETELDAALSHAASLAAELSGQVQSADDPAVSSAPISTGIPMENPSSVVDAELEQLEQLVGTVAEQIQSAESASPVQAATNTNAIPDFMSEFTTPAEPSKTVTVPRPKVPEPVATAPGRDPGSRMGEAVLEKPGVVRSGMKGVVGGPVNIQTPEVPRPAGPPVESERVTPAAEVIQEARHAAPLHYVLQELVATLEFIDRPLARISGKVRRFLGWIAIAMIAASIVVFFRLVG